MWFTLINYFGEDLSKNVPLDVPSYGKFQVDTPEILKIQNMRGYRLTQSQKSLLKRSSLKKTAYVLPRVNGIKFRWKSGFS